MFSSAWLGQPYVAERYTQHTTFLLQVVETEAVANTEALPITSEEPKVIEQPTYYLH